jgi:hypothetical protein
MRLFMLEDEAGAVPAGQNLHGAIVRQAAHVELADAGSGRAG